MDTQIHKKYYYITKSCGFLVNKYSLFPIILLLCCISPTGGTSIIERRKWISILTISSIKATDECCWELMLSFLYINFSLNNIIMLFSKKYKLQRSPNHIFLNLSINTNCSKHSSEWNGLHIVYSENQRKESNSNVIILCSNYKLMSHNKQLQW